MKDTIEKVLFDKLQTLSENVPLDWIEFQFAFNAATGGKSLSEHLDDVQSIADELEKADYARFLQPPMGTTRIVRGDNYAAWMKKLEQRAKPEKKKGEPAKAEPKKAANKPEPVTEAPKQQTTEPVKKTDPTPPAADDKRIVSSLNSSYSSEAFISALEQLHKDPERAKSVIWQLSDPTKSERSIALTVTEFISLMR